MLIAVYNGLFSGEAVAAYGAVGQPHLAAIFLRVFFMLISKSIKNCCPVGYTTAARSGSVPAHGAAVHVELALAEDAAADTGTVIPDGAVVDGGNVVGGYTASLAGESDIPGWFRKQL